MTGMGFTKGEQKDYDACPDYPKLSMVEFLEHIESMLSMYMYHYCKHEYDWKLDELISAIAERLREIKVPDEISKHNP